MRVAAVCAVAAAAAPAAAGAAVLREARVSVVYSTGACDVMSRFVIAAAGHEVVEHRLMLGDGGAPEFAAVGARLARPEIVGRTVRLSISLTAAGANEFTVRYRVVPAGGAALDRCPLLVPSAPTDGVSRAVRIDVEVPRGGTRLPGEFPAFTWNENRGVVAIGHLPSFVRVPHAPPGAAIGRRETFDFRRVLDLTAVAAVAVSTLAWIAFRRRRT
jgi:hypothetical protein